MLGRENNYIPMDYKIKQILNIVVVIAVISDNGHRSLGYHNGPGHTPEQSQRLLETILKLFDDTSVVKRPLQLAA